MSDQPNTPRGRAWWTLQSTGWFFLAYLICAQLIPVFDYQLGVEMGTQESAEQVTDVGVAYWKAFAFGDLVTYAPLLLAGLIGHLLRCRWGAHRIVRCARYYRLWAILISGSAALLRALSKDPPLGYRDAGLSDLTTLVRISLR